MSRSEIVPVKIRWPIRPVSGVVILLVAMHSNMSYLCVLLPSNSVVHQHNTKMSLQSVQYANTN